MTRILSVLGIAAALGAAPSHTAPPGLKARAPLAQVTATAKKWRADAVLTHVSSLTVNPDGTAKSWIYTFYAPQSKVTLNITVALGAPLDTLQVQNTSTVPIGDVWVDSDKAVELAKQHQLKGSSLSMGLVVMGVTGNPVWAVNGGFAEGDASVMLDGKTGSFIRRQVISYK